MILLERLKETEARRIVAMLERTHTRITRILEERLERMMRRGPQPITTGLWTTKRYQQMLRAVNERLSTVHREVRDEVALRMQEIGLREIDFEVASIRTAMPVEWAIELPEASTVREIVRRRPFQGKLLREWFSTHDRNVRAAINETVRQGMISGETVPQIIRSIRGERGILEGSRRGLAAVVRTAINHTSTHAREETYRANAQLVKGVQIVATLDSRTTDICKSLDGRVYAVGEGKRPPFHIGCRTTTAPVIASFRELGIDLDEAPMGTRASLDGAVGESVTYGTWIMRQPAAIQNEALGVGVARLVRTGQVDIEEVFRMQRRRLGKPITLREIEERLLPAA